MRLRAVPVLDGKVRIVSLRPPLAGVIATVATDHKRFEVIDDNGVVREFALRSATGRFEHPDGSWIRFLY